MDELDIAKLMEDPARQEREAQLAEHLKHLQQEICGGLAIPAYYWPQTREEEQIRAEVRQLLHGTPDPDGTVREMQAAGLNWWQMRDLLARGGAEPLTPEMAQEFMRALGEWPVITDPTTTDQAGKGARPKVPPVKAWSYSPKVWANRQAPAPPKVLKPRR